MCTHEQQQQKIDYNFSLFPHVSLCDMREKLSSLNCYRSVQYGGSVYVREFTATYTTTSQ